MGHSAVRPTPPPDRRFWAKVNKQSGGCWLWTGALRGGYGRFARRSDGRQVWYQAHRSPYEEIHGPVPGGLPLDHICRNKACVNPDHLEPVGHVVNVRRGWRGGVYLCPAGHEYSGDNVYVIPSTGGRVCRKCRSARRADEKNRMRERRKLGLAGKPGNPGLPVGPIRHRSRLKAVTAM